jgi:hypothetical protein
MLVHWRCPRRYQTTRIGRRKLDAPCGDNKRTFGNPTPCDLQPARDWDRPGNRFGSTEKSLREKASWLSRLVQDLSVLIAWTRETRHHRTLQEQLSFP